MRKRPRSPTPSTTERRADEQATGVHAAAVPGAVARVRGRVVGAVGVALAAVVGVSMLQRVELDDHAEVIAHRGASKAAPENTLAAVRRAIDDGADMVEIDGNRPMEAVFADLKKHVGVAA